MGKENENSSMSRSLTFEYINEYSNNRTIIKYIQKQFSRLNKASAVELIKLLLKGIYPIEVNDIMKKEKTFRRYNLSKIDNEGVFKIEVIKKLRKGVFLFIEKLETGLQQEEKDDIQKASDGDYYVLNKYTLYNAVRKLTCDEGGEVRFKYDFDKNTIPIRPPHNTDRLQHCYIQILSDGKKFDYPVEFTYFCTTCRNTTIRKVYETVSTQTRISCPHLYDYITPSGDCKSKVCKTQLQPDIETSTPKDAYYYDMEYEDENGNKFDVGAISFNKYPPGFYECVLFKIPQLKKTELYQIMDVKSILSNTFVFPSISTQENYLFTLQKEFDRYIKKQTGMDIYGLYPIKVALIIQTAIKHLGMKLNSNIQVVGDASTGKSTVLKYYGFLLNNHLNLSTNGLSISIPALRGTRENINLLGRKQEIVTTGYLGTYYSIHIDEAGENRELIQNLKTFLAEENYSYNKAGATGGFHVRTAHVNVSQNLDYTYLGQYRGMIRKAYREFEGTINGEEQEEWNEEWDLHKPEFEYTNPYLRKIIRDKRLDCFKKQTFWIDGFEIALHQRFPFYFYLVNEGKDKHLIEVVKGNVARNVISENLEVMRKLKSDDIVGFFKELEQYKDGENDYEMFVKVDEILEEYGLQLDVRVKEFYYNLVKVSRIINKRKKFNKDDIYILQWFLEKMHRKLDVGDTVDYDVHGSPYHKEEEITVVKNNDDFGLPEGEFE